MDIGLFYNSQVQGYLWELENIYLYAANKLWSDPTRPVKLSIEGLQKEIFKLEELFMREYEYTPEMLLDTRKTYIEQHKQKMQLYLTENWGNDNSRRYPECKECPIISWLAIKDLYAVYLETIDHIPTTLGLESGKYQEAKECYFGYSPERNEFIRAWDLTKPTGILSAVVVFFVFEDTAEGRVSPVISLRQWRAVIKNDVWLSDEITFYGAGTFCYSFLHKKYPDLLDLRKD